MNGQPPLAELVKLARMHRLPVLVDAAGELPPRSNLRDIIAAGADLVVFSGGKAIRGPQSTGILCGRRDLIASAMLQMLDMDDHFGKKSRWLTWCGKRKNEASSTFRFDVITVRFVGAGATSLFSESQGDSLRRYKDRSMMLGQRKPGNGFSIRA